MLTVAYFRLVGCATTPKTVSRPAKIDTSVYSDLMSISKDYNFDLYWDRFGRVLVLCKPDLNLRLRTDSSLALVNGRVQRLEKPVLVSDGLIYIPKASIAGFIDKSYLKSESRIQAEPARTAAYQIKTIVVDPGHGGKDPGAIGSGGLKEKTITLDIAKRLCSILSNKGFNVIMTREDDSFVSLWQRSVIANENQADIFLSIHANASRAKGVNGFEIYYLSEQIDDSDRAIMEAENSSIEFEDVPDEVSSTDLQAILWDITYSENRAESIEFARWVCKSFDENLPIRNRGIKGACFYVLKGIKTPGVLIETGFISNPEEEARLKTDLYRQMLAESISSGISAYKGQIERANGYGN